LSYFQTQVVVNVVGRDLDLERGAVSKAILGAAGPRLQWLLTENRKTGNFGDVIITDGCSLKSDMVFHAVVPPWDKQGNAHKVTHLSTVVISISLCVLGH